MASLRNDKQRPVHFDELGDRLLVQGLLRLDTALSIGSGGGSLLPTDPDNPVMRNARHEPFIPGSSLKGVLRSYLERLNGAGWLGESLTHDRCIGRERLGEEMKKKPSDELADAIWERLCPVCRLFGSLHYGGRIHLLDASLEYETVPWWDPKSGRPMPLETRTGVSIDRESGTAAGNLLFDREVVPAGVGFRFRMIVENPTADNLLAVRLLLAALQRGEIPLGGATTRGLGRVRLEAAQARWISPDEPDAFLDAILSPEDPFVTRTGWQELSGAWDSDGAVLSALRPGPIVSRERLRTLVEQWPTDMVDLAELVRRLRQGE